MGGEIGINILFSAVVFDKTPKKKGEGVLNTSGTGTENFRPSV
jgi:hypothetical protein